MKRKDIKISKEYLESVNGIKGTREIAKEYNVSKSTILKYIKEYEIDWKNKQLCDRYPSEEYLRACNGYKLQKEIAIEFKISQPKVSQLLKKYGIEWRRS